MAYKKKLPPQLANYEMVEDRLKRFWEKCPNGRIDTEVINVLFDGKGVMVKAHLYEHRDDKHPIATGIALDYVGKGSFADSNYTELAETSAIGRAIANSPHQSKKANRPSREEMQIALGRQEQEEKEKQQPKVDEFYEEVKEEEEAKDIDERDELFEHVKEVAKEWEKAMIEENPDIDPSKDHRMKFNPNVMSNMDKCRTTLNPKSYETKWNQWKSIYQNFPIKKLEPRDEEEEIVGVDEAKKILEDGGINLDDLPVVGSNDLPPVEEHFHNFPNINKSAPYKGRDPMSDASVKQVETIGKCLKFRKLQETKAVRWVNQNYRTNYNSLNELTKEEASQIIGAFFSESKR